MDILQYIAESVFPPRYGPEWGSGGIFGLKYYRGVLYFNLAFEAIAYFIKNNNITKQYRYELIGSGPRSGGDTYNAVDTVDEYIYFGGWVHAPAIYIGRRNVGAQISFRNKYSHVHVYNIYEDSLELIWRETLGHETDFVGEISEIVYDAVNDRLLLARGDGMSNLGIYQIDRKGKNYKKISEIAAQKGSYFYDHICFDMFQDWVEGVIGIQCIDLVESSRVIKLRLGDIAKRSIDRGDVYWRLPGVAISAYGRFFLFTRGGVFVGNPLDESLESVTFYRLFDFGLSSYSPRRTMAKPFGGGILVAFNSYSEAIIKSTNEYEYQQSRSSNTIVGPSILLYITPPTAKIVATLGARVTGFEVIGDKLLIAYNTMANTFKYDAIPIDAGYRGFLTLDQDIIVKNPPSTKFIVRGYQVKNKIFGGIPLTGYREPVLTIVSNKTNKLYIYEYALSLPSTILRYDVYGLTMGKNIIDLKSYRNSIISLKLEDEDDESIIEIDLM